MSEHNGDMPKVDKFADLREQARSFRAYPPPTRAARSPAVIAGDSLSYTPSKRAYVEVRLIWHLIRTCTLMVPIIPVVFDCIHPS